MAHESDRPSVLPDWLDQQPVQRVVGRRRNPPAGVPPQAGARAAMAANATYLTRAPKGIFFYRTHEEMTRDRERWTLEAVAARTPKRG